MEEEGNRSRNKSNEEGEEPLIPDVKLDEFNLAWIRKWREARER